MELRALKFRQRSEGRPYVLYATTVPAEVLRERAKADIFNAESNPEGYQREPVESRVRQIAVYARDHEGLLPTAILVNLREQVRFEADPAAGKETYGTLRLPDDQTWWVVDGQHRVTGITRASDELRAKDANARLDYDVPVIFTEGLSRDQEMRVFHIVNSRAKSVPTDLAAEILRKEILHHGRGFVHGGRVSEREYRKAVGAAIARYVNERPGPWEGRVRLPNEKRNVRTKPIQVNAFASSLEQALRDQWLRRVYEPETNQEWPTLSEWVHSYWVALQQLMPDAFGDVEQYYVQRTAGLYAFHMLLLDILERCRHRGDFSVDAMVNILKGLGKWVESDTWHRDAGEMITRATGMANIRQLADLMRDELDPLPYGTS